MVAASYDPAWASQTEIGNKNDTLEEAVFLSQQQISNSPELVRRTGGYDLRPKMRSIESDVCQINASG